MRHQTLLDYKGESKTSILCNIASCSATPNDHIYQCSSSLLQKNEDVLFVVSIWAFGRWIVFWNAECVWANTWDHGHKLNKWIGHSLSCDLQKLWSLFLSYQSNFVYYVPNWHVHCIICFSIVKWVYAYFHLVSLSSLNWKMYMGWFIQ